MSNPHTPTVAEEVEAIINEAREAMQYDDFDMPLRPRLTTLLTRLRAAEDESRDQLLAIHAVPVQRCEFPYLPPEGDPTCSCVWCHIRRIKARLRQEQDNG